MKISNILTCAIVSILVSSCALNFFPSLQSDKQISKIEELNLLKKQSEKNNTFVVNAKNQLAQLIGNKNFDNYIIKNGILNCKNNENQSFCVLNFYLNEYYKLKYDLQLKKITEQNQVEREIELNKIKATDSNIKNYCQLSADFMSAIYTQDTAKISSYYQPLFKMSEADLTHLYGKINKDNYSHFLIEQNPTILFEMKSDYVEKCLTDPKNNIINYLNIFRQN
ncbi:hypothetical protein GYM75_08010 [Gilliamella sp. ESL0441]|uniref:hypothetical protein n=1 Tax=Gilliamella sp. ESL0441 TaxID=2704654 RepID=UPI001C6A6173|nr:hypothetical protein [Gilliamella sp. ESL0441]QYN44789.1 hypothetical protein GYM75_08010 [Gilliamella sp. ESL0441]